MLPPIARAKGQHVEPSACESPTTHFVETSLAEFATAIPDLANQNLYAARVPLARTWGVSFPAADKVFEREIRASGKANGPGICVVIDWLTIYEQRTAEARAAGLNAAQAEQNALDTIRGVLAHELCHAIDRGETGGESLLECGIDAARKGFADVFSAPEQPDSITNAAKPLEPWHGHELRFIHCCGLLFNRMLAVNPIPFGDVCRTSAYGLSEPKRYVQAMQLDGDGEGGTLREILDRGPGDVLKARWRADIFNWYRLSPKTDAHTAAAEKALSLCGTRLSS